MTPQEFRRIREMYGPDQKGLAILLGFADANQIHRMETGKRGITPQTAILMRLIERDPVAVAIASEKEKSQ